MIKLPPIEALCCAYWDFLRGLREKEPTAKEFSMCECSAEATKRWCRHEFEKTVIQKAIEQEVA